MPPQGLAYAHNRAGARGGGGSPGHLPTYCCCMCLKCCTWYVSYTAHTEQIIVLILSTALNRWVYVCHENIEIRLSKWEAFDDSPPRQTLRGNERGSWTWRKDSLAAILARYSDEYIYAATAVGSTIMEEERRCNTGAGVERPVESLVCLSNYR